jgi:hypothetical protein
MKAQNVFAAIWLHIFQVVEQSMWYSLKSQAMLEELGEEECKRMNSSLDTLRLHFGEYMPSRRLEGA